MCCAVVLNQSSFSTNVATQGFSKWKNYFFFLILLKKKESRYTEQSVFWSFDENENQIVDLSYQSAHKLPRKNSVMLHMKKHAWIYYTLKLEKTKDFECIQGKICVYHDWNKRAQIVYFTHQQDWAADMVEYYLAEMRDSLDVMPVQ